MSRTFMRLARRQLGDAASLMQVPGREQRQPLAIAT